MVGKHVQKKLLVFGALKNVNLIFIKYQHEKLSFSRLVLFSSKFSGTCIWGHMNDSRPQFLHDGALMYKNKAQISKMSSPTHWVLDIIAFSGFCIFGGNFFFMNFRSVVKKYRNDIAPLPVI